MADWLDRLDSRVGDGLEAMVCAHHRRRLARHGWSAILPRGEPGQRGWATDGPGGPGLAGRWWSPLAPVRPGNDIRVLVDGAQVLPEIEQAILGAKRFVHIAGWHATPGFRLTRAPGASSLRDLLADAARRVPVRLLLWAGPPLPAFEPTRGDVRRVAAQFCRDSDVHCALDRRERPMHCHHEKLVLVDDQVAFVGGIDLTDLQGDRYDHPGHQPHGVLGWHDSAAVVRGPVVGDVAQHFRLRWAEVTGERVPDAVAPDPVGDTEVQLLRTVPERVYRFRPHGEFTILDGYVRALRQAQRLIYLENQFLWAPEVVDILIDKLRRPPTPDLRVLLVLPARPNNGADTTRGQLGRLVQADDGARRLLAVTVAGVTSDGAAGPQRSGPVYVHSKVGIVDDRWLTVGSANLNGHSLFNDTEVNLAICDTRLVAETRLALWAEHTGAPVSRLRGSSTALIDDLWRPLAEEQTRRVAAGLPRTHGLSLLRGVSRRTERLQGPLRGLLVDG